MRGEINGSREREDDGIGIQIRSRRESGERVTKQR